MKHQSPYNQAKDFIKEGNQKVYEAILWCQELLAHAQHSSGERSFIWKQDGSLYKYDEHTTDKYKLWIAEDFRNVRYINKLLNHLYRSLDNYDKRKHSRVPHNIRHINLQFGTKLDNQEVELP